jgi:hypothetical protein
MKLILDTNVADHLCRLYQGESENIMTVISQRFTVVATSETFCELLYGLSMGDDDHFEMDKARFKIMVGEGRPRFLRMPGAFALHTILNLESPKTSIKPVDFVRGFCCVLHAKSRADLFEGRVRFAGRKERICGFNPGEFSRKHDYGKEQHKNWLIEVQEGREKLGTPVVWAGRYAASLGHILDLERLGIFANGLSAVYQYGRVLCQMVRDKNYNFDQHSSDWVDLQQLHFLSDPNIHLLTDDRGLKERTKGSSQYERVIPFREFLTQNGFAVRH